MSRRPVLLVARSADLIYSVAVRNIKYPEALFVRITEEDAAYLDEQGAGHGLNRSIVTRALIAHAREEGWQISAKVTSP